MITKKLSESDLKIGDILIYENADFSYTKLASKLINKDLNGCFYYVLDYLISWFDPGKEGDNYKNIYHAAIWGNININRDKKNESSKFENNVVEAGPSGVQFSILSKNLKHPQVKNIYVCRLKNKDSNFENKINSEINTFYNDIGHYSFETAWLLAVICSLRYSKGQLHKKIEDFFGTEVADYFILEILNLINFYNNENQKNMIACSTLVAMIYKNAGYELPVNIFQSFFNDSQQKPNFNVDDLQKILNKNKRITSSKNNDWKPLKETVVTPRQLMESPDVELIGYLTNS